MQNRFFVAGYRIFFAILTLAAIVVQYEQATLKGGGLNFFFFFTVESNILAALLFLISAAGALAGKRSQNFALLRGAAVVYMVVTGGIYLTLLSGLEESLQTTIPWVNSVLHYIMPVVVLADWIVDPPVVSIHWRRALWWLLFPAVYGIVSLVRGSLSGWYPYPFLNPTSGGYGQVAIMMVIVCAVVLGVIGLVVFFSQVRQRVSSRK